MNETKTETEVKTGYQFLEELCSFNADFSAFDPKIYHPLTNRAEYIRFQLEKMGVAFEIDMFNANNPEKLTMTEKKFVNIYSFFKGENATNDTIIFLAHHDVNNKASENCQDNTASVSNLLHLCGLLKGKTLNKNVLVAWTDAEEIVSPDTCGAKRLAILTKLGFFGNVTKAINLELTANGTELWVSCLSSKKLMYEVQTKNQARLVRTPYNDAFVLENNGVESVCIGTLTPKELGRALDRGFCSTWALCHRMEDTFDKANANEMKMFVENVLIKMVEA